MIHFTSSKRNEEVANLQRSRRYCCGGYVPTYVSKQIINTYVLVVTTNRRWFTERCYCESVYVILRKIDELKFKIFGFEIIIIKHRGENMVVLSNLAVEATTMILYLQQNDNSTDIIYFEIFFGTISHTKRQSMVLLIIKF